jgi:hypothetical protein
VIDRRRDLGAGRTLASLVLRLRPRPMFWNGLDLHLGLMPRANCGQAICSYQIVKRLRQLVTSNGQGSDAAVISSLLIAGNCQAIIKDRENGEKFLGIFGRGGARGGRLDARRDRRPGGSRLRTEWLSALSAPLAMASWSERQILQYCAVGLRRDRWPAGLSLTRGSVLKLPQSPCWLQRLHENSPGQFPVLAGVFVC